ncbi:amino acid adenylation domain-containing protein [Kibdelosporangium banguiense]|uniref:Amino acid adenylation domain-containing protein n=1 Tax=Kibdelosporangium banguiense TaxID=1365924 RepID=A0ABS4TZ89_9PSEU|nr:non-ribosomal peptide synthetase [Kibdelosporangium banguiense]MBP2329728.1 amino acid adenylation domain-containing protein [Kibdelosporangium banguiense]
MNLPLSFGQEQLWFLDQLSPEETTYNLYTAHRLRGPLDADVLRRSLTFVLDRHAALRASFGTMDGAPFQVIAPSREAELEVVDLGGESEIEPAVKAAVSIPFDLSLGPLYRFRLWRLDAGDHVFLACFHHIITDGWSNGIIDGELGVVYRALAEGRPPQLPEPAMTFADHVRAQRKRLHGEVLEEELQYWQRQLDGLAVLELPTDRLRPAMASYAGDSVCVDFPADLVHGVRRLAHEQGTSLFMILTTALAVVLHRYSGQDDIPIGVPMLGRIEPELESVVGLFVNMVVLRTDLSDDPAFAELLERATEASMDVYDHQEASFERVVERVQPVRDPGRNPLFQVSIQVVPDETGGLDLPGVRAELLILSAVRAMFDLVVNVFEGPESVRTHVTFATALFDRWRVEAMVGHLTQVLTAVVEDPSIPLSRIPMLNDDEREELLAAGRGEEVAYTSETLHASITKVAQANPDAVAAVCRGVEMTYGELDRKADLLAAHLRTRGVQHEQIVAIAMDRDLDTLVAMLGVLKAGAAFAMIDPSLPVKRLEYILSDTKASLVIARSSTVDKLPEPAGWSVVLADAGEATVEPLAEWATQDSLAYVLYTSGSTGQPKGVLIEHRALRCFVEAYRRSFDMTADDRMLQLPALTFDASMGEIFTGLTIGATLVLVSPEEGSAPDQLAKLMREQRVTYADMAPAILSILEAGPYPDLKYVVSGADAVPAEMVNKWNLPGRRFLDLYGPTEAAVACTEYECEHKEWVSPPPIGHPHVNRLVYVVDQHNNLVPRGVPGELLIGGDEGLARGYLNQPELTAEKFVPDPFRPSGRVYRSGDLVRWREDFELEFLGRIDTQVKLRGLRIELGEIESVILSHPQVRMAVVLLGADSRGEQRLVGYYTATTADPPSPADLRRHLSEQLPEYMVPTAWVSLAEFPLTTARKIDRKALPEPVDTAQAREFIPPSTATEIQVAAVFGDVLGVARVGANENFFDLGGNSLQAMRVVSRINKAFGVKVNVRLLYGTSTVAAIASKIDGAAGEGKSRG